MLVLRHRLAIAGVITATAIAVPTAAFASDSPAPSGKPMPLAAAACTGRPGKPAAPPSQFNGLAASAGISVPRFAGTDDILYRNNATGDTGFYAIHNGANTGWVDIGASSTAYSVVGVGDLTGNGTDDVLFRNNATGDTGFYAIFNGVCLVSPDPVGPPSEREQRSVCHDTSDHRNRLRR